jgi:sulfite reductase alpha subunit-like flavoprotein
MVLTISDPKPYSRKNPVLAKLLVNQKLNLEGSEKETRFYAFSLARSGLQYEVGDSMGVFVNNDDRLVEELLHVLHFGGDEAVTTRDALVPIFRIADTTSSAASGGPIKFTTTSAPASASAKAMARPTPELAPVTSAFWPPNNPRKGN